MHLLETYGFDLFSSAFTQLGHPELVPARVVAHLGAQLVVAGARAERAEPSGRLRHELADAERPTVGDWVALADADPGGLAIIHHVLPRRSALIRRAAGTRGEAQAVAANVDTFFVVTSANRDANARRLERYLAAIAEGGAEAVVVVNKIDLCTAGEVEEVRAALQPSLRGAALVEVSAATGAGLEAITVAPGRTVGLVGMSGVGKSSLLNRLLGEDRQAVLPIDDNDRGRHSTTRRELVVLPGGGLVIDTPGMRSFGLADDDGGVAGGFDDVLDAAARCRFSDCRHEGEPGCSVEEAIADGTLDPARLAAYEKLGREAEAAARRRDPALAARSKRTWKSIHMAQRERAKHDPKLRR